MKQLNEKEKVFVELMVGTARNSGELEDIHSQGRITQEEMGKIKDGFRKQMTYMIRILKEGGLIIDWSPDSSIQKYFKGIKGK
jgi:predicted transcriptional regulator